MKKRCRVSCVKMLLFDDLLENQYLFQILQTSITIKSSESVVKSGDFQHLYDVKHTFFLNEGGI